MNIQSIYDSLAFTLSIVYLCVASLLRPVSTLLRPLSHKSKAKTALKCLEKLGNGLA
jgi:hypothetical protein